VTPGLGEVAALIDQGRIPVEYASVVGRDGTPVSRGNLFNPALLYATVVGEQNRPWTQAETQAAALHSHLHNSPLPATS